MPIESGTYLGPYEVVAPLGAGGMGEVYRARDPRLHREVAIKVLPEDVVSDPDRLRRFEIEAKAVSALNHPAVLTIFDTGRHGSAPYVVFELLEGETLRQRLERGALPVSKAVAYSVQIARGLDAAHGKGVVHRDLKPENLFLTPDGRVKILDFGLAKLQPKAAGGEEETTASAVTDAGMAMGTVGYMSPEQVLGQAVDHRCDIFALGAVLYEMLTGRPAFRRSSSIETLNAILKEDPPALTGSELAIPAGLGRTVGRCLEKNPAERFRSAHDLAFALETLSTSATAPVLPPERRRTLVPVLGALALTGAAYLVAQRARDPGLHELPTFEQLTFQRGTIWSARFAPDGQTVIYSATWQGHPVELFEGRVGSREFRRLGLGAANVLSISPTGEMALCLDPEVGLAVAQSGTLARASLAGGAPRELMSGAISADWMPGGHEIVLSRSLADGKERLELSSGRVLFETPGEEGIGSVRASPDGRHVAFIEYGEARSVVAQSLEGERRVLSSGTAWPSGLAWAPSGREVWFTEGSALHAVELSGHDRIVARIPGGLQLLDIFRDGRVLLAQVQVRFGVVFVPPGGGGERDLSWRDSSNLNDLSSDGKMVAFHETAEAGGSSLYLRRTDASPAVDLSDAVDDGDAALSPDGKWVLATSASPTPQVLLLPTGPGPTRRLPLNKEGCTFPRWLPDQSRVVYMGDEPGRTTAPYASYVQELASGAIRLLASGLDFSGLAVAPDGRSVAAVRADRTLMSYAIDGSGSRVLASRFVGTLLGWSPDGRFVYSSSSGVPGKLHRTEIRTGATTLLKELVPADPAGVLRVGSIRVTPDGRSYAYSYVRRLSNLYVASGLK
jgi:serine/threonine protein kinase